MPDNTTDEAPWWRRMLGRAGGQAEDEVLLPGDTGKAGTGVAPGAGADGGLAAAIAAAGVTSAAQFQAMSREAADGRAYGSEVDAFLQQQAVRLFGPADGPARAKNSAHLPVADRRAVANDWCDQADAKYGIGRNGEPPKRASAPPPLPVGRNAESTDAPDTRDQEAPRGTAASLDPTSLYAHRKAQQAAAAK